MENKEFNNGKSGEKENYMEKKKRFGADKKGAVQGTFEYYNMVSVVSLRSVLERIDWFTALQISSVLAEVH